MMTNDQTTDPTIRVRFKNVDWDAPKGAKKKLPTEVELDLPGDTIPDDDDFAKALSDRYDYCVNDFEAEIVPPPGVRSECLPVRLSNHQFDIFKDIVPQYAYLHVVKDYAALAGEMERLAAAMSERGVDPKTVPPHMVQHCYSVAHDQMKPWGLAWDALIAPRKAKIISSVSQ